MRYMGKRNTSAQRAIKNGSAVCCPWSKSFRVRLLRRCCRLLMPNAQLASKSVATWRAAKCGRENTFAIMLHRKKRCPCARVPSALVTAWLIRYRSLEPSKKCTAALKFLNYFSAPLSALHVVQRAMPLAANTLHHTCQIKLEGDSKPPNRAWIKIWMKFNVLNSNMIQSMIYRDVAWRLLPAM